MTTGSSLTRTDRNLWNAIVTESVANVKYQAFAQQALIEGHPEIAQIFQEVAGAENIHGINHLRVAGDVKSTAENLRSVIAGEAEEAARVYPQMIQAALDEGRRDAADTFRMAMDREQHHLQMFEKSLNDLEHKLSEQALAQPTPAQVQQAEAVARNEAAEPFIDRQSWASTEEVDTERWRIAASSRVREVVFGAQDGLVSTLALVTAVAAAVTGDNASFVLVAGLAGALAGMISMATGAFLGSRAEQDLQRAEIEKEARELEEHPAEELAELVSLYQREGLSLREARGLADKVSEDKDLWLRTLLEKELGISPDITSNPFKDALTMGGAFVVAAMIPILPYFFLEVGSAIPVSVGVTLAGLYALGMWKGRLVKKSPWVQGLEILIIGSVGAALSYGIGEAVPRIFG
ncbi:MAG: VIT1/CCC1 transporter family protein [Chloroflexota bacterium]|nr:VIT1/CCC1 transporter family protein [Chloroflexota bacterium]MDE2970201.1 VIT1/CCC1 transporter family protein [Chloroflexota bacterium]